MIVLPTDHVVKDKGHFLNILEDAVTVATEGLTWSPWLGITLDRPATSHLTQPVSLSCQRLLRGKHIQVTMTAPTTP